MSAKWKRRYKVWRQGGAVAAQCRECPGHPLLTPAAEGEPEAWAVCRDHEVNTHGNQHL